MVNYAIAIFILLVLFITVTLVHLAIGYFKKKKNYRKEVEEIFGMQLSEFEDRENRMMILTIVNSYAFNLATACMFQDMSNRKEKVETPYSFFGGDISPKTTWDDAVKNYKKVWKKARRLVAQIDQSLLEDMPYFSEFEPLKSYREEYLARLETSKMLR